MENGGSREAPASEGGKRLVGGPVTAMARNGMGLLSLEQPSYYRAVDTLTRQTKIVRNLAERVAALLTGEDCFDECGLPVVHRRPSMVAYQLARRRHSMIASHISPMP